MKLVFEDGEIQQCLETDQRQTSVAGVFIDPVQEPKYLTRVWEDPPTYAKLVLMNCELIHAGSWVMTASGLKRVVRVQR